MNCFEWRTRSSDYLDGSLAADIKAEADLHLSECRECGERHKHFRMIISSIASQPRSSLPVPIRKSPFKATLPRLDVAGLGRSRWDRIPWYLRIGIEGAAIVLLVLGGISAGPRLRSLYERHMERTLDEYGDFSETSPSVKDAAPSIQPPTQANPPAPPVVAAESSDDFASEGDGDSDDASREVRPAGKSEIWRFNFKSDSPQDLQPKIAEILAGLQPSPEGAAITGVPAPGGIQFDLLLPRSVIPELKQKLEKIAPPVPEGLSGSPVGETFTWYKNKSKKALPDGQTRVVIWISQL